MVDALIGGAIAAVIGAVGYAIIGLWLERRREKAQRLTIVDTLIAETLENQVICEVTEIPEMQRALVYKLDAYRAYKGQLFFLSKDVVSNLISAVLIMERCNSGIQTYLPRVAPKQPATEKTVSTSQALTKHLELVNEELLKWRAEHTRNLVLRIHRRLRNFISKIRKNSKLNHT